MNFELHTQRLALIPFDPQDHQLLHGTFTNPFVRKFLFDDEIISEDTMRELLQKNVGQFKNERSGLWKIIVLKDQMYAGFVGLWYFFEEGKPQLLYGLLPDMTGKGYATEAAQAIIRYAFRELKFNSVIASFDTPNVDSLKVCERLKMKFINERVVNNKPISFYEMDVESIT
jgi:ribosomal-protein-alanine N-acetyltransferase